MEASDGAPEVYLGRDEVGQHLVALIRPTARDPNAATADLMEVRRYSPDGSDWVSLGTFPGMRRIRSPVPLSPHFIGAVIGDTAFVTDGLAAQVEALEPTGATARPLSFAPAAQSPAAAHEHLAESVEDTAVANQLRSPDMAGQWDSVPRFSDVVPDPAGLLWLEQYDSGTDSHWVSRRRTGGTWIVSTTDGQTVAEVAIPGDVRLMSAGLGRVAGVRIDELGVERVVVYGLQRD